MSTNNICFYKKEIKVHGCNMKSKELLDCAYRGMCGI